MTLTDHVRAYVAFKRTAGLAFRNQERLLGGFARHAEARGDRFVRVETVLDWASQSASPHQKQRRLHDVCGLAAYLHAEDERHELPHRDALGRATRHRPPPHLLSWTQVRRIMDAALELPPPDSMTPVSVRAMLGLIAATGLRRAEATGLRLADDTPDGLRIRNAKFGKQRLVPLHESVRTALDRYLEIRLRCGSTSDRLFVLASGRPVSPDYLTHVFIRLARQTGLRAGPGEPGPRLHDLRHYSESWIIPSRVCMIDGSSCVFNIFWEAMPLTTRNSRVAGPSWQSLSHTGEDLCPSNSSSPIPRARPGCVTAL